MSQSNQKRARSGYRVIETERSGITWLSVRKVWYDDAGKPERVAEVSPPVEALTGDGLVDVLNELAKALTQPSLLAGDFPKADA
jgi:hypothetical protein